MPARRPSSGCAACRASASGPPPRCGSGPTATRTYEATDPVYLKGTYRGQDVVMPADFPYTEDNCQELGFIDYSKQAAQAN